MLPHANTPHTLTSPEGRALRWGLLSSAALHLGALLWAALSPAPAAPVHAAQLSAPEPVVTMRTITLPEWTPEPPRPPEPVADTRRAGEEDATPAPAPKPAVKPAPRQQPRPKPKPRLARAPQKPAQSKPGVTPPKPAPSEARPASPAALPAPARPVVAARDASAPSAPTASGDAPAPAHDVSGPTGSDDARGQASPDAPRGAARGGVSQGQGSAVDRRALQRGYMGRLGPLIQREYFYPAIAKRMGQEGRVLVVVVLDARGELVRVQVRQSAGHAALDEAALSTIRRLRKLPAPPAELLRQGRFTLLIPIRYELR